MKRICIILVSSLLTGCVIKPQEASKEPVRLDAVGASLGYNGAERTLPELPAEPSWRDVLRRAFLANGELEAAYFEWAMAVHRIDQAATWPSQNLELGFEYMFSSENMKAFDRTTFSAGLMDGTELPNKTYTSATVAWREAQAAAERFRAAKFMLQRQVLQAWADYVFQAERVRIQEENTSLLRLVASTAASRVRTGAAQQEQVRADVELRMAENDLLSARATLDQQRAALNGLLRRDPSAPLLPEKALSEPRHVTSTDDELLAAGVANNAELAALGFDERAREAAVRRAKLEYMPEINPMATFTGSVSQSLGAAIGIPTQLPKIRAMVAESRADLRRVQASLSQSKSDKASQFAVAVLAMRDAERRADLFNKEILPLATRAVDLSRQGYSSGTVGYLEMIDAQGTLLDTRLMYAEARAMHDKMLAEIEELAGVDVETIKSSTTTENTEGNS